ncbi:hypothetical protein BCU22_005620 [Vibrio cyclitrophicus]|uniref:hypothetical protein n=1 Tax=Vibrio cyclitrophicus TaxID=47951 RepID=UPI000C83633F|nr:hypothetical protein [Vibrio cyclitrophicus]PMJ46307.1 hypothetical protein BCU22_22115 [Vibrio cyclitrophicus]
MNKILGLLGLLVIIYHFSTQKYDIEVAQEQKLNVLIEELNKGQFTEVETSEIKKIVHVLFVDNKFKDEKPTNVSTKGVQLLIKKLTDNAMCTSFINTALSPIELGSEFRSNFITAFLSQLSSTARDIVEKGKACQSATTIGNVSGIKFEFYGRPDN